MVQTPPPSTEPDSPNIGPSRLLRARSSSLERQRVRRTHSNADPQQTLRRSLDEYQDDQSGDVYDWPIGSNSNLPDDWWLFNNVEDPWTKVGHKKKESNTTRDHGHRFGRKESLERHNPENPLREDGLRSKRGTITAAANALADLKLQQRQAHRHRRAGKDELGSPPPPELSRYRNPIFNPERPEYGWQPPHHVNPAQGGGSIKRSKGLYGRNAEATYRTGLGLPGLADGSEFHYNRHTLGGNSAGRPERLHRRPNRLYDSKYEPKPVVEVIADEEEDDSCPSDADSDLSFDFAFAGRSENETTNQAGIDGNGEDERPEQPKNKEAKEKADIKLPASQTEDVLKTSYNISQSGYVGTSFSQNISIAAKATQDLSTSSQTAPSLFRWIHITPPVNKHGSMSFDAFVNCALDAPSLNQADKIDLKKTLLWVREKAEEPLRTLQGQRGCYLDPIFKEVRFRASKGHHAQKRHIRILCMPYFSLNRYFTHALPSKSRLHPVRTLLQSQYPSVSKERDMQQAVSVAAETPSGYCYHVPQMWSLILNDSLLVTYAPVDIAKICGNKINITTVPTTNSLVDEHIEVFEAPSRLWLFPLDTCRCWFNFISHFAEEVNISDNVEDYYKVYHDGRELTPLDWPTIVQLAEISRVRVQVKRLESSRVQLRSRSLTSLPKAGISEDDSSSSNSSASDGTDGLNDFSEEPSQKQEEQDTQSKSDYSWNRKIASHSNGETILPLNAVAVEKAKSLGYELVVQDENVIFSKSLTAVEIDVILHLSLVFKKSREEMERHLQSVTENDSQRFHLFIWIGRSNKAEWAAEGLYEALFTTLKYLWNIPNSVERKAFKKCPLSSKREVKQFVNKNQSSSSFSSRSKKLYAAAKALLAFFLPIEIEAAIVRKYWGAVNRIICDENFTVNAYMLSEFESMAQSIMGLRRLLSDGKAPLDLRMPDEFAKAWLHSIMFLMLVEPSSTHRATNHLSKAHDLILRGKLEILRNAAESSLRRRQAALPQGILLAAINGLLHDMNDGRSDVITTYWDYLRQLELDIKASPLKRAHQRKITSLKQEVDAVIKTLEGQSSVLLDLHAAIDQEFYKQSSHRDKSRDPDMIIFRTCLKSIQAKIAGFEEIMNHANTLRIENLRMIESNKDRQEAAIFAFTIVTVIFLPLSFVSSIFGMNTSDVRDMRHGQWLYWAAALPLTGLIIILCLIFTGDIIDFPGLMRKLLPHSSTNYDHNLLPTGSSSSSDTVTDYHKRPINTDEPWGRRISFLPWQAVKRRFSRVPYYSA